MQFSRKSRQIVGWRSSRLGLAHPPPGKSWIRHCYRLRCYQIVRQVSHTFPSRENRLAVASNTHLSCKIYQFCFPVFQISIHVRERSNKSKSCSEYPKHLWVLEFLKSDEIFEIGKISQVATSKQPQRTPTHRHNSDQKSRSALERRRDQKLTRQFIVLQMYKTTSTFLVPHRSVMWIIQN